MLTVKEFDLPGVKLITPRRFDDSRGFVAETVNERSLAEIGIAKHFVQENQSFSKRKGTVRGCHLQKRPFAQAKLVRALKGRVYDVAIDVRAGSPTFGRYVGVTLDEGDLSQFYIPAGFAHGFCTLTDDVTFLYKMDDFYTPGSEAGFIWNDPDVGIDWPVDPAQVVLSDKDRALPRLKDLPLEG